ncbi:hypothetical protein PanWU01x14_180790, partial [Parasponia andersonii]
MVCLALDLFRHLTVHVARDLGTGPITVLISLFGGFVSIKLGNYFFFLQSEGHTWLPTADVEARHP